ncbi:MAG: serine/threonine-protein kinase [Gemmataceae bacterium]
MSDSREFTWLPGQRPLDGFTLKRGIGRGGFGEVYFAISDGGKEVALKLVRGDHLVERLRGVAHRLNLKHPNLVALYDLKKDSLGDHWVVMEYVAGEGLNPVIQPPPQRHPPRAWSASGSPAWPGRLPPRPRHRPPDPKPANVFIENGVVKVGDYGLSKSISTSQRTAQTQSVGTVHYMAPEISTGNYNKQIDTYAAGVILYEMVTGRVPFDGESAGEILMKHLTSTPDMSKVPREWVSIVTKALSKNPAHRYSGMAEMARDVEAVGGQESARHPAVAPATPAPERPRAFPLPGKRPEPVRDALPAVTGRQQVMELAWSMVVTVLFAGLATALWAALRQETYREHDWTRLSTLFFLTVAAAWAVLIPAKFWTERRGDGWSRRLVMLVLGGVVGLLACWLDGWALGSSWRLSQSNGDVVVRLFPADIATEATYVCYYALAFFVLRWWRMTARRRSQRFSFAPILGAGFWGAVLLLLVRPMHLPSYTMAAVVLVMAAAIVQLVSPWEPPAPAPARRVRLRYA